MCKLNLVGIYLLKVNNRNTRIRCEICSKLTIKTPERSQTCSSVSIVNFEQVIAGWDYNPNEFITFLRRRLLGYSGSLF